MGDIATFFQWSPWRKNSTDEDDRLFSVSGFSLIGGLEWPSGSDSETPETGAVTPSLLQVGSGTYDPIIGIAYQGSQGNLSLFHQTFFQAAFGESEAGLEPGDVTEITTGIGYRLFERVQPNISFDAVFRGKDELNGAAISNTGAALLFVSPGLSIRLGKSLTLDGTVRVPVHRDFVSTQLAPGLFWRIGMTYRW